MSTLAWILLLAGILVIRQVTKGRIANIGEDLSDAFLAITKGDSKELTAVLARTGEANQSMFADLGDGLGKATAGVGEGVGTTAQTVAKAIGGGLDNFEAAANKSVSLAAILLGTKAKGYRWAATGPDYYDCSGLMYRACQRVGYKGGRFTTFTIGVNKAFKKIAAPGMQGPGLATAGIDDIVVWPTKHMGVITGPNKYYSARSVKSGIGESSISGHGGTPVYYRMVR